jgi:hypothetical protein
MEPIVYATPLNFIRINSGLGNYCAVTQSNPVKRYVKRQLEAKLYANVEAKLSLKDLFNTYMDLVSDDDCQIISHTYPTAKLVRYLRKFIGKQTCLSVGSGSALWEYILATNTVCIIATDIVIWPFTFMSVEKLDAADAVEKYATDILFIIWPDTTGYDTAALKKFKGQYIIIVFDPTMSDQCSKECRDVLNKLKLVYTTNLPIHYRMSPKVSIYRMQSSNLK